MPHDDGVLPRPRGDGDLDLGVLGGELGEVGFYEAAKGIVSFGRSADGLGRKGKEDGGRGRGKGETYFMPRELPAQSQK